MTFWQLLLPALYLLLSAPVFSTCSPTPLNVVPAPMSHYWLAFTCFSLYVVSFVNLIWFHVCDQYFHVV